MEAVSKYGEPIVIENPADLVVRVKRIEADRSGSLDDFFSDVLDSLQ